MSDAMTHEDDDFDRQLERDQQALRRACLDVLGHHFDAVQIIATRHDTDGTMFAAWGEGNVYARIGAVSQWIVCQKKQAP